MRYCYRIAVLLMLCLASCGEAQQRNTSTRGEVVEELPYINFDSLYGVMDERYNMLCDERSAALGERNVERREQLLEANDRACAEFRDSLQRIIAEEQRRQH